MQDAKPLLSRWLTNEDYVLFGQAVVNGYSTCNVIMSKNIIFSAFTIGRDFRSRLSNLCVEYELDKMCMDLPDFFPEIQFNNAHNCLHLRIHKKGLSITAHFMGRDKESFRRKARIAKNREILADRNGDMFAEEAKQIDISNDGFIYCQILHGGIVKPELSMLAIPTRDQLGIFANCELPVPEPEVVSEEKIEDFILKLNTQTEEFENGNNIYESNGRISA